MVSAVVSGLLVALVAVAVLVFNQPLGELLPFLKMHASPQNRTVIVVGGGLAGMSAALEAAQNGASVILLDKEKGSESSRIFLHRSTARLFFAQRFMPHSRTSAIVLLAFCI